MSRRKARAASRRAGGGSLTDGRGSLNLNSDDDRTGTVVEPAVETLAVSCACGKESRPFPQADVRAGTCQWWCGRRGCEESA